MFFLAIATNIPQRLKTGFVVLGHKWSAAEIETNGLFGDHWLVCFWGIMCWADYKRKATVISDVITLPDELNAFYSSFSPMAGWSANFLAQFCDSHLLK